MAEETRHRTINKMLGDQGRTKTWLAERTGFSYSYVTQVLRGEKPVTEEFVDKATRALGGRMVLEIIRGEAVMIVGAF